ncbi:hypothetical protein EV580_3160 [Mycobacterium sp. BK086]|nr:hypothetical protein EV580_3160 [Mycobacterium sp. BK086]
MVVAVTDESGVKLDANLVAAKAIKKPAALSWPLPVDRRLDQLVEIANSAGANVRRNELAAALVVAASTDPEQLLQLVLQWRKRLVRDVVIGVDAAAQVLDLPRHGPGRRSAAG